MKKITSLFTALSGVLIAVLVYQLKDRVELRLKEQEIGVTSAADMRDLELSALNENATQQQAISSSLALATFGDRALPFLIQLSAIPNPNQETGARVGLRAVGVADHDKTCSYLKRVLDTRSRLYSWETMTLAAEISADLACTENITSLCKFRELVERRTSNPTEFARAVQNEPPLDQGMGKDVIARLSDSANRLNPTPAPHGGDPACLQ
ncbi:MAG: hypothetical protein ABSB49_22935 [Polyangia bacterium]